MPPLTEQQKERVLRLIANPFADLQQRPPSRFAVGVRRDLENRQRSLIDESEARQARDWSRLSNQIVGHECLARPARRRRTA